MVKFKGRKIQPKTQVPSAEPGPPARQVSTLVASERLIFSLTLIRIENNLPYRLSLVPSALIPSEEISMNVIYVSRRLAMFAVLNLPLFLVPFAEAQTLSEWKERAEKKGCESIPFSTLRGRCEGSEREKDSWCYADKWRCDKDTEGLIASINGMKKKIESLKDERSRSSNDDEKSKLDSQIKDLTDRRESFKQKLEVERKDILERIDRGKKCQAARIETQVIFKDAITEAGKVESGKPERPYAEKLIQYWTTEGPRHRGEIEEVGNGIRTCEDIYKKNED
jgi:hypothetical protein